MRRRVLAGAAALLIAGCSSQSGDTDVHTGTEAGADGSSQPVAVFDGTYSVAEDPGAGADTWIARSTCDDDRCVATVSIVDPNRTDGVPFRTKVFDFVGGRWTAVDEDPGRCTPEATGEPLDTAVWTVISLEPKPDGALVGTYDEAAAVGACTGRRTLELTRVADVNPRIRLADPSTEPPLVDSPAKSLRGSYAYNQSHPPTGTAFPTENYRGETHCLRTGERCQTLLRGDGDAVLALTYAEGRWTGATPPLPADCPQRPTARYVTTSSFEMPQLPADPLPILTGRAHQVVTGGCDSTFDLDLELKRTGD
jgi:serine/threonine-protein kinase